MGVGNDFSSPRLVSYTVPQQKSITMAVKRNAFVYVEFEAYNNEGKFRLARC